jgi:2-amino-4-hydroxy-6-hydroxymethyldihydropteridine diphosphokinase
MVEALIGIGSNFKPESALRAAVAALEQRFGRVACSSVYRAPAAGVAAAAYLNLVAKIVTATDTDTLSAELASIETAVGRTRDDPRVCRLDLDLLVYGRRVDAARRLPRPGLYTLPFVLVPLADVAPQLAHPLTGESCSAALATALRPAGPEKLGDLAALGV